MSQIDKTMAEKLLAAGHLNQDSYDRAFPPVPPVENVPTEPAPSAQEQTLTSAGMETDTFTDPNQGEPEVLNLPTKTEIEDEDKDFLKISNIVEKEQAKQQKSEEKINLAIDKYSEKKKPPQQGAGGFGLSSITNGGFGDFNESGYALKQDAISKQAVIAQEEASQTYLSQKALADRLEADEAQRLKDVEQRDTLIQQNFDKYEKAVDTFARSKIDPNHFWASRTTGDKIGIGISMILGSLGSGSENKAVSVINKAIDRDIDAQKAEISKLGLNVSARKNLLSEMKSIFKDQGLAETAARLIAKENTKTRIEAIAGSYKSRLVHQKSIEAIADIDISMQKDKADFESKSMAAASRLLTARGTKGYKVPEALYDLQAAALSAKDIIGDLQEINETMFKSFRPNVRAEAIAKVAMLSAAIRKMVAGGGNPSDADEKRIAEIAQNPTAFFTWSSSNKLKYLSIIEYMENNIRNHFKVRGIQTLEDSIGIKRKKEE